MKSYIYIPLWLIFGCTSAEYNTNLPKTAKNNSLTVKPDILKQDSAANTTNLYTLSALETLTNVQAINSNIMVNLRYSDTNNFLTQDLYGDMDSAYLQESVAQMLSAAQQSLTQINPNLHLLVWDATRPRSVQWKMWNALQLPIKEKVRFVSNPKNGSIHNYGCAVDLTICQADKTPLDMGTDFDYFGRAASTRNEATLIANGLLTVDQVNHRKLLRTVMTQAGFSTISSEWWHFNAMSRAAAQAKYSIVE
jgi:zinc D-Ala-D-Ala dipeptidase